MNANNYNVSQFSEDQLKQIFSETIKRKRHHSFIKFDSTREIHVITIKVKRECYITESAITGAFKKLEIINTDKLSFTTAEEDKHIINIRRNHKSFSCTSYCANCRVPHYHKFIFDHGVANIEFVNKDPFDNGNSNQNLPDPNEPDKFIDLDIDELLNSSNEDVKFRLTIRNWRDKMEYIQFTITGNSTFNDALIYFQKKVSRC